MNSEILDPSCLQIQVKIPCNDSTPNSKSCFETLSKLWLIWLWTSIFSIQTDVCYFREQKWRNFLSKKNSKTSSYVLLFFKNFVNHFLYNNKLLHHGWLIPAPSNTFTAICSTAPRRTNHFDWPEHLCWMSKPRL